MISRGPRSLKLFASLAIQISLSAASVSNLDHIAVSVAEHYIIIHLVIINLAIETPINIIPLIRVNTKLVQSCSQGEWKCWNFIEGEVGSVVERWASDEGMGIERLW